MKKNLLIICAAFALCSCGAANTSETQEQPETTAPAVTEEAAGESVTTSAETTAEAAAETVTAAPTAAPTEAETVPAAEQSTEASAPEAVPVETSAAAADPANSRRMSEYPQVYKDEVKRMFDDMYQGNEGMADISYTLRDLDADGVPELIVKHGTAEYDMITTIYTVDANCSIKVIGDQLIGFHTSFGYDTNSGQLVLKTGHMGTGSCTWISFVKGNEGVSVEKTVPVEYTDFDNYNAQMAAMSIADLPFTDIFSFDMVHEPKTYIYSADGSYEELTGIELKSIN